jgi:chitodextrinase
VLLAAVAACRESKAPSGAPPGEGPAGVGSPAGPGAAAGSLAPRPDEMPPARPPGLQAYAVSEGEVRLTWLAPPGDRAGVTYEVLRGDSLAATTPSLEASDTGLAPSQSYCYAVRAVDAAGRRSAPTAPACVQTPDRTPPTRPGSPEISLATPARVELTWAPSTDNVWVEGYELLQDGASIATGPDNAAASEGLAPGREYCWTVRAFDRAGNRSPLSAPSCFAMPDGSPPTSPAGLTASAGPGRVSLAWGAAEDDVGVDGYEVTRGEEVVASVSGLAWVEQGLPAAEHCFAVRALDRAGNRSAPSATACAVVPDTTPPSPPEGLSASAPGETSVVLRWRPSLDDVGVTGYEVIRDGTAVARSAGPAAGEEGLRPAAAYCYQVRAIDAAGNRSDPSGTACVTTPDLTPPGIPPGVESVATSDRAADVSWGPSTDNVGVAGYEVLREGEVAARTEGTRVRVSGLAPGRQTCHVVRAFDRAGNRSAPSPAACTTPPDVTPPSVPGTPLAAAVSGTQVALAWSASTDDVGVAGYELLRGDQVVARASAPAAVERGLQPSTEYCYRVRAQDAAGNRSEPSAPACVTTPEAGAPGAPSNLEAATAGPRAVLLRWSPSPDPGAVYAVHWEKGQRIGTTRFTTYRVEGLKAGARRCFQVSAVDVGGRSSGTTWPVCASAGGGGPGAPDPAPSGNAKGD